MGEPAEQELRVRHGEAAVSEGVTVRQATRADGETLLELVRSLAEYEELEPPDAAAQARLLEHAFGPAPRIEAFLAETGGEAMGYAIVLETYSSFLALPTLYLEDLFVRPDARRRGAGGALLRHLAALAVERGCGRMEWVVLDWNELARNVYRRLGAEEMDGWTICRLTGEALRKLASTGE
jgi:GNAT superfamily N-acetyltransferase